MSARLDRMGRRLETDRDFLAGALADYARSEGLDDADLARKLGCRISDLPLMRWCLRPRPEQVLFRRDVEQIASRFGASADVLASVVRRSDSLGRFTVREVRDQGYLLAARDRREDSRGDDDGDDAGTDAENGLGTEGEPAP